MLSRYSIAKSCDGWIVSADGERVLVCQRKTVALRIVRDAIASELSSAKDSGNHSAKDYASHGAVTRSR